jgi:uncharacterized membrane protein
MQLLVAGLVIFLGIHLVPALPALRSSVVKGSGEARYKGVFSLFSAAGLAMIVWGYAIAPRGPQWLLPSELAKHAAPFVVTLSLILLAAANMRTHIRRALGHPMLIGVGLWSATHLLANGHAKATLLFGAFLVYAAVDLASAVARGARKHFRPKALHDAIAVGSGLVLGLLVMAFHRQIFGIPVVHWGF